MNKAQKETNCDEQTNIQKMSDAGVTNVSWKLVSFLWDYSIT